jgi:hypothetical protein
MGGDQQPVAVGHLAAASTGHRRRLANRHDQPPTDQAGQQPADLAGALPAPFAPGLRLQPDPFGQGRMLHLRDVGPRGGAAPQLPEDSQLPGRGVGQGGPRVGAVGRLQVGMVGAVGERPGVPAVPVVCYDRLDLRSGQVSVEAGRLLSRPASSSRPPLAGLVPPIGGTRISVRAPGLRPRRRPRAPGSGRSLAGGGGVLRAGSGPGAMASVTTRVSSAGVSRSGRPSRSAWRCHQAAMVAGSSWAWSLIRWTAPPRPRPGRGPARWPHG